MAIYDRFLKLLPKRNNTFKPNSPEIPRHLNVFAKSSGGGGLGGNPLSDLPPTPEFGGSRTSIPKFSQGGGNFGNLPRRVKSDLGLDERTLNGLNIEDLMDKLMDAHPDISFAIWNFLRIANSGYDINVTKLGTGKAFAPGKKDIDLIVQRLELPNVANFESSRSIDKVVNQVIQAVVTRGAGAVELVLTPTHDDIAFIAPVDPATITFKFENFRYVPYQLNGKLSLDIPTFFYEGLDERIDNPYGRSPLFGAINMVMFQLQLLNDIKQVIHNQGYPRLDITILEEVLLKRMPLTVRNNEAKKAQWLNDKLKEIIDAYNNLEPDDTFVHFDSIAMSMVGGKSGGGGALMDPEKLFSVIDNLIMAGLKTVSTILGRRSSGNTESFAKLETKLYIMGVKAIQQVVETVMSRALTMALNIRGKQGVVEFKFKPIEIRTELEQAQFAQIHLQNIAYMRDQGWIDQIEASNLAVSHDPVSDPNLAMLGKGGSTITNKDGAPTTGPTDTVGPNGTPQQTGN